MDINKNYYNTLGVKNNATSAEIKKNFREKANKTHPDKQNGDDTLFKNINEAYQTLNDKKKKQEYDIRSVHGNSYSSTSNFGNFGSFSFNHSPFDNNNPFSIFEKFFDKGYEGFAFNKQREQFQEELDIIANINVDLKRIYENKPITIKYKRKIKCQSCNGTGFDRNSHSEICEICDGKGRDIYNFKCEYCLGEGKIYTGTCKKCNGEKVIIKDQEIILEKTSIIRDSTRNINRGFGHQSKYYRQKIGSLIVNINFEKNENYEIKNDYDLHYIKNIHYQDAIEGKELIYIHVDQSQIKIKLPKKTKDGDTIRLKEKGLLKSFGRGDLYIKINITIDYDKI